MRESGAIEQDADIVSFIYRPEYYGIQEWDDDERSPTSGQAELIVAKHRNGGLDKIRLKFVATLGKFEDIQSYDSSDHFESRMNPNDLENSDLNSGNNPEDDNMPF